MNNRSTITIVMNPKNIGIITVLGAGVMAYTYKNYLLKKHAVNNDFIEYDNTKTFNVNSRDIYKYHWKLVGQSFLLGTLLGLSCGMKYSCKH
ncbi:MAG: hypothetical protein Gaeavirus11_13 [Gaeavirus sp.]|uniref:Uncharacterized protein n=1 Tax=Gaeavirus sp. TaxID=2487767 RepID=A0A3G5A2T2_9VIRU|nr:MAG: hypothetical protein Gaeavirus11_13 [Gaeavirus sp.]